MNKIINLPFSVADHVKLNVIPNYLKGKVEKCHICVVVGVTVYYGNKGVSPIYRLFDLNTNYYFVVHADYIGEV